MTRRAVILLSFACVVPGRAQQPRTVRSRHDTSFSSMTVIWLRNGPNKVDLNGDTKADLVVKAWRDNGNAHGFSTVTFYLSNPDTEYIKAIWLAVPFADSAGRSTSDYYRTYGGADCILSDMRLLRSREDPRAPVMLVTGDREGGQSFGDTMPVTFTVYRFVTDTEGLPGSPPYYFKAARIIHTRRRYCDV